MLHGGGECGQGRLALGLRAAAPPSSFLNAATSRSSCSRRALCCDIVPTLRMLAPIVMDQSLPDPRRRRHVRALARVLPDDALAFFAHTALQPPMDVDGSAEAGPECDIDIDDGEGEEAPARESSGKEFESGGTYKGVVERNIYSYGDLFTVKFTAQGQLHFVGSFATIEEARAARDSATRSVPAAAAAPQHPSEQTEKSTDVFTNCVQEEGGGGQGSAAAAQQITTDE